MKPTSELTIDCYVDADFAGLWKKEDHNDENCVKSLTAYVLCISKCPVVWMTRLQEGTTLSTMEAEYVHSQNSDDEHLCPMSFLD